MSIKTVLQNQVTEFRKWWQENYTPEEIHDQRTDDQGYPGWDEIEDFFEELLSKDLIRSLDKEDQTNLLWLIARNWDIGRMIGWLYEANPLSNLGDLKEEDFIMLAATLIEIENPEFDDAKSQFASSFKKIKQLTPAIETILLKYFNDKREYTKRTSLYSLAKLGYPGLLDLIESSWDEVDDEFYKRGCLQVLDTYVKDNGAMKKYLSLSESVEGDYLKAFCKKLKLNSDYH